MSEDQVALILQAISDARHESSEAIGALALTTSSSIGALASSVARFEGNIEARVVSTEDYIKGEKKWGNIKKIANVIAVPLYGLAHAVAVHFGVRI